MKLLALSGLLLVTGCTSVQVTGEGNPKQLTAKPPDCPIRFFRLGTSSPPFDEVGSAALDGSVFLTPGHAEDLLRPRACEAGADAVVITYESYGVPFVGSQVHAVFVVFKPSGGVDGRKGASLP